MGNKVGRRQAVDDEHTRPQGLYQLKEIDLKKLRKLILEYKLAPCYPGADECALDLDECPICFLYYPSLNRSRCCRKMICTECLLQLKASRSNKPTKCPFCKTTNYLVEYRGARTMKEKRMEQVEEQRIVEAQIRIRMQELQDEEDHGSRKNAVAAASYLLPDNFEEQMMLAMAVSLAEFRASTRSPLGVTWPQ